MVNVSNKKTPLHSVSEYRREYKGGKQDTMRKWCGEGLLYTLDFSG